VGDGTPMIDAVAAKRVRLVGLDVDGTLTDGGIYLGAVQSGTRHHPIELKKYDIQDGIGIHLLRTVGIKVLIVTGRTSESVRLRALELGVDGVAQDPDARKLPMWRMLLARHRVADHETAFIGDDIPDLAIMRTVGMPVAVANAAREVHQLAAVRLSRAGGAGAVREFAEALLTARGEWTAAVERYVAERTDPAAPSAAARRRSSGKARA
ncbi:MAG: KdsC family phosphatase, partial [Gemmatimonadaceae bacterium]